MRRITLGTLDLSTIDEDDPDTEYIYNEVFGARIYDFRQIRLPDRPTIMDVGANIGLYAIWAQQRYQPRAIYCYEASPRTFVCLADNARRLIRPDVTEIFACNQAIAATHGETLLLSQSTKVPGISTLFDRSRVSWVEQAAANRQLEVHEVVTSTVSAEIEAQQLAAVDILKIDVEGYFMEVLKGIAPEHLPKIRNIVMEVDYLPETGIRPDDVEDLLKAMGYSTDCLDRSQRNNLTFYAWRP
jgi:FkbM family methyltransferase